MKTKAFFLPKAWVNPLWKNAIFETFEAEKVSFLSRTLLNLVFSLILAEKK